MLECALVENSICKTDGVQFLCWLEWWIHEKLSITSITGIFVLTILIYSRIMLNTIYTVL